MGLQLRVTNIPFRLIFLLSIIGSHTPAANAAWMKTDPSGLDFSGLQTISASSVCENAVQKPLFTPVAGSFLIKKEDFKDKNAIELFCLKVAIKDDKKHGILSQGKREDLNILSDRVSSTHRAELIKLSTERFKSIISDQSFQKACCSDNKKCKDTFQRTKFVILSPSDSGNDEFKKENQSLSLQLFTIAACKDMGCLNEIFYHELGHACQFSILSNVSANEKIEKVKGCTGRETITWPTYIKYFGLKLTECIKKEIFDKWNSARLTNSKVCHDQWVDEAFASLIFASSQKSGYEFQRICTSTRYDQEHPAMQPLLKCKYL